MHERSFSRDRVLVLVEDGVSLLSYREAMSVSLPLFWHQFKFVILQEAETGHG